MKIDTRYAPEKCASKDQFRHALNNPHLDTERKVLVSTDGHRMTVIPIVPDEHDTSGPVPSAALKSARKGRKGDVQIGANGAIALPDGSTMPRPDTKGHDFPPWTQVLPTGEPTFVIALDAQYLLDIAQAIGAKDDHVLIEFHGHDGPMRVLPGTGARDEGYGVLMPLRFK